MEQHVADNPPMSTPPPRLRTLLKLLRYKAWANSLAYDAVMALPEGEALKPRLTTFDTILHTLSHIHVVDDIFRHHLCGTSHGYTQRNSDHTPAMGDLQARACAMDRWYLDHAAQWREEDLDQQVTFTFVGGGQGAMTKEEIILHLVNHATYHRGFVGDMLRQVPHAWAANDLTVFLRDIDLAPNASHIGD
jgi:uncharacterized damage-inducible protein DinB